MMKKRKTGFSLVEMMIAVVIFGMSFLVLYYVFSQGTVELQKASYVALATTIAKGEMDQMLKAEFFEIKVPDGLEDWKMIDSSDKLYELYDWPEEYLDRFERKIEVEDIYKNRLIKVVVKVRWFEFVKNEKQYRQFNYPTFISNTRVPIYFP
ncbi:MAG: hypothetical protein C0601_09375 [Candidatus Muiribacterium halophilum]|uniref:Uncharacterized protein n=1 Tax=Muiribacterium halophilum TaxID=2053465 RepID=A0A2N5ZDP9_MUIH1|nr:MAG: hypothetical protein C0601_09375 [Candidatus Muirbacterium halophilum]